MYADNTTLYAETASPSDHINLSNSLNRDLFKIQSWSSKWQMKLCSCKIHSITIIRYRTSHPPHLPLDFCRVDVEVSSSIKFLGVSLDDKLTFLKTYLKYCLFYCSKIGLIRKCYIILAMMIQYSNPFSFWLTFKNVEI